MTQSSTPRNIHTGGLRRPALALAFGTAAAASVLAPVASMAATASYNDILPTGAAKAQGILPVPAKFGGATAALQTKRTTPLPTTAVPLPTTSLGTTIRGDVYSQSIALSAGVKRTTLNNTYAAWKTAATPVINAWIAYTKAVPAKKVAALKVYNTKLAVYNKKAAGALSNGPTKWMAYSNAYNAWSKVYTAQLATVQSNHFKLATKTAFAGTCTSADDRTAAQLNMTSDNNAPVGDAFGPGLILKCDTTSHMLSYYLKDNGNGHGWEQFQENITTDAISGAVTDVGWFSNADPAGQSYQTYITGTFTFNANGVNAAVHSAPLAAIKRSDINGFATKALYSAGTLLSPSATCISAGTSATLTCQAFTESLQSALNAAYAVSPK